MKAETTTPKDGAAGTITHFQSMDSGSKVARPLQISGPLIWRLKSLCERLGVDPGQFAEDIIEGTVTDFLEDLEQGGNGPVIDFIQDRAWTEHQARRHAELLRRIPGQHVRISVRKCTEFPGRWRVVCTVPKARAA